MKFTEIWVYLSATPLLGLTVTLVAYQAAFLLYSRLRMNPLANPVAIAVAILVALLWLTKTPYQTYFEGAQFVHFLLGPATVALAVPLYANLGTLRRNLVPLAGALVAGSLTAVVSAVGIGCSRSRPSR
jgi:putative effector of murein hydrolase